MERRIKIISRHKTLTEAVEVSKMNLSYNEPLARRRIKELEKPHCMGSLEEAFVTEDGIYWIFKTSDEGLRLLHEFLPFMSCMTGNPFQRVEIEDNAFVWKPETFGRNSRDRRMLGREGILVTSN